MQQRMWVPTRLSQEYPTTEKNVVSLSFFSFHVGFKGNFDLEGRFYTQIYIQHLLTVITVNNFPT